ncbi:hypothetical protein HDG34_003137 [Paraburkholderia sp. HC6.4b]|uniref:hypothetical protein n=1 Tax=unclassified Paraburkholderia TaxID=2615204 RepID=UPI00161A41AD|nr:MULTISPECIES: hypothetical protein [unclassified Paraburkholderia]MBB5409196.1 hypothetical protein [Paraburkholderia sp. HC6.4b]MBB5450924.1 hypothetical protein [Paraburkholderia sp. Kb1A]
MPGATAHADSSSITDAIKAPSRQTGLVKIKADIVFNLFVKRVRRSAAALFNA